MNNKVPNIDCKVLYLGVQSLKCVCKNLMIKFLPITWPQIF